MTWEEIAADKRAQRKALIDEITNVVYDVDTKPVEKLISNGIDIPKLIQSQAKGEISAIQIITWFIQRAIAAQESTNCLTEVLFKDAIQQARSLDSYRESEKRLIGPLHGIPMSVKDQFNVKGVDTTLGYVGRSFKPATDDAVLVNILKSQGAVILTKTNIPQSILWGETENPLWGLTTHPLNPELTPGGSTGGEAALLAMGGSICGWGTDIGGSIRAPSHLCGLAGLKPTSTRFPYAGVPVSHEGQEHVPSSIGPISPDLTSLITTTKAFLNAQPWLLDPKVTPIPWREDIFQDATTRPLKIGLILDDGVVKPHPPISQAVREAANLLEKAGHIIVPWDTSDHLACIEVMDQFYRADGGEDIKREVDAAGEPMIPHVQALVESSKPISVFEYWQLNKQKIELQQRYNEKWNASVNLTNKEGRLANHGESRCVDVILSPVMPHTAIPHRSYRWVGYTKIWNFHDYTALSFLFTKASTSQSGTEHAENSSLESDNSYKNYIPRNPLDEWNQKLYNPEAMKGLPIGVQIIGRRFDEEKVLGVASVLERLRDK